MALVNDALTIWEIGFRWAGQDPDRAGLRIPLPVRDNFRLLIDAIWNAQLESVNLSMDKRSGDDDLPPEFFIRHHIDTIEDCVSGKRCPRRFLKFVLVERWAFQAWCERWNSPLPEFWFPPGWHLDYQWPDGEEPEPDKGAEPVEEPTARIDKRHRVQMACQQIALFIWAEEPKLTIKEVAWRKEIQELGGGAEYEPETVESWVSKVDPRAPSQKRGRKRKNNPGPDPTGE